MQRKLSFRVNAVVNDGETVCVTGNCESLGFWKLSGVLPLLRESDAIPTTNNSLWSGTVFTTSDLENVQFRYVICVILGGKDSERKVVVRNWETAVKPRFYDPISADYVDAKDVDIHQFGEYGGITKTQGGWMTVESIVQLKLYNNPIQIWKKRFADKKYSVKVTAVDLQNTVMNEEPVEDMNFIRTSPTWPIIEISVMNREECTFRNQQQYGHLHKKDDFVVFQAQVINLESIAYMVDIYLYNSDDGHVPEHVGYCYILPSVLQDTVGSDIAPIIGDKHVPIGQLTVHFLVIKPMSNYECDLSVSYAKHWNFGRKALEVGHRGAGNSFHADMKNCADIRENTLGSLKHACDNGADFVEFDVQLSKDLIPIIYHDFNVCLCTKKKYTGEDSELITLPVKDLTLQQLQELKLLHVKEKMQWTPGNVPTAKEFINSDHLDNQPFPMLKSALEVLDPHLGFNVEIKWDMLLTDGTHESSNPFELNMYLDTVLKTLLENSGKRRIIISCFHPDICTMVRLKQNKYPVLFLTVGRSKKTPDVYLDPRTRSIEAAVYFATSAQMLGIDVNTEEILDDPGTVCLCKSMELVMFCWGDDNSDPAVIKLLKSLKLDGIIYDKIDIHKDEKVNIFLMEAKLQKSLSLS